MTALRYFIISLLAANIVMQATAQNADNAISMYTIQRGEDIEDIATKFGILVNELKKYNPELDVFLTGMNIKVPKVVTPINIKNSTLAKQNSQDIEREFYEILLHAQEAQLGGEYQKASKLYSKIIKKCKDYANWSIYLSRGYCQYQRKKYKSAIEDLNTAYNDTQCSDSNKKIVAKFLEDTKTKRKEQLQRRGELWGEIIGTTALIGANIYTATMSAKTTNRLNNGTFTTTRLKNIGSMSNAEFNAYINQSMQQIQQLTNIQVQTQLAQEQKQVNNSFIQTYRAINGRDPSEMEIQQNYNSYVQAKTNTTSTVRMTNSGIYGNETSRNDSSSSTDSAGSMDSSDNFCLSCGGTGHCYQCHGTGIRTDNEFGTGQDPTKKCGICNGTGLCPQCGGKHI